MNPLRELRANRERGRVRRSEDDFELPRDRSYESSLEGIAHAILCGRDLSFARRDRTPGPGPAQVDVPSREDQENRAAFPDSPAPKDVEGLPPRQRLRPAVMPHELHGASERALAHGLREACALAGEPIHLAPRGLAGDVRDPDLDAAGVQRPLEFDRSVGSSDSQGIRDSSLRHPGGAHIVVLVSDVLREVHDDPFPDRQRLRRIHE